MLMHVKDNPNKDISNKETYTRWVYAPRHRNVQGGFNKTFISLREREEGISGQIIDRAGHKTVILWGMKFRRSSKDGTPKVERFVGYTKALAGKIREVADEKGDKVDVIFVESKVPFHAEIRFELDCVCIVGNNQHPRFLRYKDKLRTLLQNDIYEVSDEEIEEALKSLDWRV